MSEQEIKVEDVPAETPQEAPAEATNEADKPALTADLPDDAPAQAATDWPDDWRDRLAGDDEATKKILARLSDPKALAKKLAEQEKLIRSGKHKAGPELGEKATEEEVAAYRKAKGIPDAPEGYLDAMKGLSIGDEDKPLVEDFLADAHGRHATPDDVQKTLEWYYRAQEKIAADQAQADRAFRSEAVESMRQEMGPDYRANMTDLKAWLQSGPEGLADMIAGARLPSGELMGDHPAVIGWLVQQMRELNPLQTVVPDSGGGAVKNLEAEIDSIEKTMREDMPAYRRDQKMQDRYRQLLEAKERVGKRAA
jgi:hypothetical protein